MLMGMKSLAGTSSILLGSARLFDSCNALRTNDVNVDDDFIIAAT